MPTIHLTVNPESAPNLCFDASQLAVAVKGKKPSVLWQEDSTELVKALWKAASDSAVTTVRIGTVQTSGMDRRMEKAKLQSIKVPSGFGPGKHILMVKVDEESVPLPVEIAEPPQEAEPPREPTDVGLQSITKSEDMARKLIELVRMQGGLPHLQITRGDGQHPTDILWRIEDFSGSLPMTTHTKGDGGCNEKAALSHVKKSLKALGYI